MARDVDSPARRARARAGRIRDGIRLYISTLADVLAAWRDSDWEALGYDTWEAYLDGEFGQSRFAGLTEEMRLKAIEELRLRDMPQRAIGAVVGMSQPAVSRAIAGRADSGESHGGLSSQVSESRTLVSKGLIDPSPAAAGLPPVPDASHRGLAGEGVPSGEFHGTGGAPGGRPRGPAPDVTSGPAGEGGVAVEGPEGDGSGGTPDGKPARPDVAGGTEPRPGPVPWDPAERADHDKAVRRRQEIEAGQRYARSILTELRTRVTTIVSAHRYGETGLVTERLIADLHATVDLLEAAL